MDSIVGYFFGFGFWFGVRNEPNRTGIAEMQACDAVTAGLCTLCVCDALGVRLGVTGMNARV